MLAPSDYDDGRHDRVDREMPEWYGDSVGDTLSRMAKTLRVGLAQINTTVGDLEGNVRKALEYVERARELGVDVVSFPELTVTGYPPEDLLLRPGFVADNVAALEGMVESC